MDFSYSPDLQLFNRLYKEQNDLYREKIKSFGIAESAFWVLYTLREQDCPLTQSDICGAVFLPKQTIHSALTLLEQDGMIFSTTAQDKRKKWISLTEKGIALCAQTVDLVLACETNAMQGLTAEERREFLRLFAKYNHLISQQFS